MTIHKGQRLIKWLRWIPLLLLSLGLQNCFLFHHSTHTDLFTDEGLLVAQSANLKATVISSHTEIPLEQEKNVMWCGSFQLAWNEACTLVGENLHFVNEHYSVTALNKHTFTKEFLDEESFVALAGFVHGNIHQRIFEALRQKFHGAAAPRYLPSLSLTPRPQDIVAYAYMFKNLAFAMPFERLTKPIKFNGTNVSCFGIGEDYKPGHRSMYSQVHIIDYKHPNDFVIELQTTSLGDTVILAKVTPENTLAQMIMMLQQRIAQSHPIQSEPGDVLKVPKFNFDITRRYAELEEQGGLSVKNPEIAKDLIMLSALQNIRFQMNEEGIRLRSESHIALGCAAHYEPRPRYVMVFDQPFLVMLKRENAPIPYFALWVANAELFVP